MNMQLQKKTKKGAVSISRIDFDKHTDVILRANKILLKKNKIDIYGATNDRYVYFKLKPLQLDFDTYYKGKFKKSFIELDKILSDKKFVVDMSAIKNDGGGSQYTFLEAIYQDCILILNKKWLVSNNNIFIHNYNCFIAENEEDIVNIITNNASLNLDFNKVLKNSKKLLGPHLNVNGKKIKYII